MLLALPGIDLAAAAQAVALPAGDSAAGRDVRARLRRAQWIALVRWAVVAAALSDPGAAVSDPRRAARSSSGWKRSLRWAMLGAVLLIYSVWVQLSGVTLDWEVYPSLLPPEAHGLIEWGGGLNDLRYLRWVLIPQLWRSVPLDIAWAVIHARRLYAGVRGAGSGGRGLARTGFAHKAQVGAILILPVLLIVLVGVGCTLLYANDPRYLSGDDTLYAMLPILEAETQPRMSCC